MNENFDEKRIGGLEKKMAKKEDGRIIIYYERNLDREED